MARKREARSDGEIESHFQNILGMDVLYLVIALLFGLTLILVGITAWRSVQLKDLQRRLTEATKQVAPAPVPVNINQLPKRQDQPPSITLKETMGFKFPSGQATLTPAFRAALSNLVPQILDLVKQYDVDTIEIVGHTDGSTASGKSTLDTQVGNFLAHFTGNLGFADNVGLGMVRALAITNVLGEDLRLKNLHIVPLSAGQMILPDNTPARGMDLHAPDENRRRIEIRVRKRAG